MKKIVIFSGSRADYGLLKDLIKKLKKEKNLKISIVSGPPHSSKKYGYTYKEILKDFKIDLKIVSKIKNTSSHEILQQITNTIFQLSNYFKKNKFDLAIVLGDRYEALAFSTACFFFKIKILHFHGGEKTVGALDDTIRHVISKFSDYHFTCNKIYKKRLIQLGERPKTIFNFGAVGLADIISMKFLSKKKINKILNLKAERNNILVTFHPETLSSLQPKKQIIKIINALRSFKKQNIIFTYNNTDLQGDKILTEIKNYSKNKDNVYLFNSLGREMYLNLLKRSSVVLGNSSSGIFEAPLLKTPTINIGNRQKGRIFSPSIFNVKYDTNEIKKKLKSIILSNKKFKFKSYFYKKNSLEEILKKIKEILVVKKSFKEFYDQ